MVIDAGTLRDLDVLSTPTVRGQTLVELVDRTRTRIGAEHLRRRLKSPADSAGEILALQQAHRAVAAHPHAWRAIIDRADPDGVERYLNSNWQVPQAPRGLAGVVAGHWRGGWRGGYLREITSSQARVLALLRASDDLRSQCGESDAAMLRQLGSDITAVLESPDVRELGRLATRSGRARIAFDHLARDGAKPQLIRLLEGVGTAEAMWSLAVATAEHGWTYPSPSSRLWVSGLRHPFLGPESVPNDLHLDDGVRVCFVTGPNMAGKSTFLKAVASAMLLAHVGCGVPAASFEFPAMGTLFSSVRVWECLEAGESFYLAEVRRIKALAQALHEHGAVLAVLDEPLRGTNVHDAAEATQAVVTRLAAHPSAMVLVASHIGEVVPAIASDPRIRLLHFAADLAGDRPQFDYLIRDGVSAQRLGMTLLRQEGVLDLLDEAAGR
jgi:DNA mismatch repair protein MutS